MRALLDQVLEPTLSTNADLLGVLLEEDEAPGAARKMRRRGGWHPHPRRGDPNATGQARWRLPVHDDAWYMMRHPDVYDEQSWAGKEFRNTYGVPKKIFDELVQEASQHPVLLGTQPGDGRRGARAKPIELKVAATLQVCQAGLLFKTASRLVDINEDTVRVFFHRFMALQVQHEYTKHVHPPTTPNEVATTLEKHAKLGFPGCISMFDGVKWEWGACPFAQTYAHTGKEGYPTKLWMVGGDVNRLVHSVHGSHIGARNDLTVSRYDPYLQALRKGERFGDVQFELYTGNGDEKELVSGAYAITDNGFHKWRTCQMPSKVASDIWLKRQSKRMESVRKPGSECIFGVGKRRFRLLALPCMFQHTWEMDNCFKFLISLHNRLLRHDGLSTIGEEVTVNLPRVGQLDSTRS